MLSLLFKNRRSFSRRYFSNGDDEVQENKKKLTAILWKLLQPNNRPPKRGYPPTAMAENGRKVTWKRTPKRAETSVRSRSPPPNNNKREEPSSAKSGSKTGRIPQIWGEFHLIRAQILFLTGQKQRRHLRIFWIFSQLRGLCHKN